jgi:hypothetical protein
MHKLIISLIIFTSVLFSNCGTQKQNTADKISDTNEKEKKDSFNFLAQYWQLDDADHPTSRDISFTNDNGILFQSGIVFINDSSLLENPAGEMAYGKFKMEGNTINVVFDNSSKAIYQIQHLSNDQLILKRVENKHTSYLKYKGTNMSWPVIDKNPFSKQNYQWCNKPKKPEDSAQIRNRVKQYVRFCQYYFYGFVNGRAKQIDFIGLPNCLDWYQGGITIQNEDKLDKKWENCFYSQKQAFEGRQMLEDAILKKYDWDIKETNWLIQTASVLQQIYNKI